MSIIGNIEGEYKRIANIIDNAAIKSLNRAGRSATVMVIREMKKRYVIKKEDLDDIIEPHKANKNMPVYTVDIPAVGIPLIKFGSPKQFGIRKKRASKRKKKRKGINPNAGVKVTVIKKKRHLFKQTFIATMGYGKGIFIRRSYKRSDVMFLYGVQSSALFGSDKMVYLFTERAVEVFAKNFFNDVKFKLNQ